MILKYILTFILTNTIVVAQGATFKARILSTVSLASVLAPFVYMGERLTNWVLNNSDYTYIVLGAIMVDYIFGTLNYFLGRKFDEQGIKLKPSLKYNAIGLITKLTVAVAGGFLFEGLNHLVAEVNLLFDTLKIITRVVVFLYPAISAWDNLSIFSNGKFPPTKWLKKVTRVYNNFDIKEFNKDDESDKKRNSMTQEKWWNWLDDDKTFRMNWRDLIIVPFGLYAGFDQKPVSNTEMRLVLTHTIDNKTKVNQDLIESKPFGVWKSKQGVIVTEDDDVEIIIDKGTSKPRIDLVVGEHEYVQVEGGSFATYKVIKGTASDNPKEPKLTDPNRQVVIGSVRVPANASNANQLVWSRALKPNPFSDDTIMHTDREQEVTSLKVFTKTRGVFVSVTLPSTGIIDNSIQSDLYHITGTGTDYKDFKGFSTSIGENGSKVTVCTDIPLRLVTGDITIQSEFFYVPANASFEVVKVGGKTKIIGLADFAKGDDNKVIGTLIYSEGTVDVSKASSGTISLGKGNLFTLGSSVSIIKGIASMATKVNNPNTTASAESGAVIYLVTSSEVTLVHGESVSGYKKLSVPTSETVVVPSGSFITILESKTEWVVLDIRNDKLNPVEAAKPPKVGDLADVTLEELDGDGILVEHDGSWSNKTIQDAVGNTPLQMKVGTVKHATVYSSGTIPLATSGSVKYLDYDFVRDGNIVILELTTDNVASLAGISGSAPVGTVLDIVSIGSKGLYFTYDNNSAVLNKPYAPIKRIQDQRANTRGNLWIGGPSEFGVKRFIRTKNEWLALDYNNIADLDITSQDSDGYVRGRESLGVGLVAYNGKISLTNVDGDEIGGAVSMHSDIIGISGEYGTYNRMTSIGYHQMPDRWDVNYVDFYHPSGYSRDNLVAFIPSISLIYFAGDVGSDDTLYCRWRHENSSRIRVICQNNENRANSRVNITAIYKK